MQSENTADLSAALAKAQADMKAATMDRTNPHYKSKYATLASVLCAIREPLAKNSLAVTQTTELRDGAFVLVTTLRHSTGQWVGSEYPLPMGAKPQEIGSALTYARRYSLSAIVCIAADEDDDAEAAKTEPASKKSPVKPVQVQPPVHPETGEVSPHAIPFDGNPVAWGGQYIAALKSSSLATDIAEWEAANATTLATVETKAPKASNSIRAATKQRLDELANQKEAA